MSQNAPARPSLTGHYLVEGRQHVRVFLLRHAVVLGQRRPVCRRRGAADLAAAAAAAVPPVPDATARCCGTPHTRRTRAWCRCCMGAECRSYALRHVHGCAATTTITAQPPPPPPPPPQQVQRQQHRCAGPENPHTTYNKGYDTTRATLAIWCGSASS